MDWKYLKNGAGEGTRTPTVARQILSLVRLPIPPRPHSLTMRAKMRYMQR